MLRLPLLLLFSSVLFAQEAPVHLFLLSGQSNMEGLDPATTFTPAVEAAFGAENVVVIKDAKGGEPILRWYKQWELDGVETPENRGTLYDRLMEKVRPAIEGKTLASVTFLWMQGERDARMQWSSIYRESLEGVVRQLSEDLSWPNIHCVVGRLSDFDLPNKRYQHWTLVREAQVAFADASPLRRWVNTDDLNDGLGRNGKQIQGDLHYSKNGYDEFGVRLAREAIALIDQTTERSKDLPRPGEVFSVHGRTAFVIEPPAEERVDGPMPWVWYAPTLRGLPSQAETWMFDRFLSKGIAIAGIDVGESYGSPEGTRRYQALYEHLTEQRGYGLKPVLLARSRGGLMLFNWATEYPDQVAGVAGIYPVCNLESYPGLAKAAPAFGLSAEGLRAELEVHNPVSRLAPLAAAGVPLLHLHGTSDATVPLEANTGLLAERYEALGGAIDSHVFEGKGHDMWDGWFQSEPLANFVTRLAHEGARYQEPVQVYILSGQSNMVGIGQVSGGTVRWGKEFQDPVVSVYPGPYSPETDYDDLEPIETLELPEFGGVKPTPFPGGGVHVVRGFIELSTSGTYAFNAGYGGSTYNVMEVGGVEVYRREVGGEPKRQFFTFEAGERHPFKVTFFTENANGLGWIWRTDIPGTLTTVVKTEGRYPHLLDDEGEWASRDDVWYKGVVTATANKPLSIGCGASANSIGPELGFGTVLGNHHDAPVLILKASQGNRSLGWDYLPPGSPRFTYGDRTYAGYGDKIPSWTEDDPGKEVDWYAGLQYDQCFDGAEEYLAEFDQHFPQHAERGYEIAGFVWWQGHKDGNEAHASRYAHNLEVLIRSLREKFEAPAAPFVIGTIGFGGWDMQGHHLTVAEAQLAVGSGGHEGVRTVETRGFWRNADVSPRNQDFHYNGNAETYYLVGAALGQAMVDLLQGR